VAGATQELHYASHVAFTYRAITVYGAPFQGTSASFDLRVCGSYNPALPKETGLGSTRFARRYSGYLS
jgi:hypothetical protein